MKEFAVVAIGAALVLASTVFGTAAPAGTDMESGIAKCAVIAGNLDRLSCFDQLARESGLDGPQPQPVDTADVGKWVVTKDKNPMDDTQTVTLMLTADQGQSRWGKPVVFVARCQSNRTEAYIVWGDYLATDGDYDSGLKDVTIRIGTGAASQQRWPVSTDSEATFAPDWAGDLLESMAASDQFVAQVTPYDESPITAVFDTSGMKQALQPLKQVCGWPG